MTAATTNVFKLVEQATLASMTAVIRLITGQGLSDSFADCTGALARLEKSPQFALEVTQEIRRLIIAAAADHRTPPTGDELARTILEMHRRTVG